MNEINNMSIEPVFLEGSLLYLRPLLSTDIRPEYLAWVNNPKLTSYSSRFRSWPTSEKDLISVVDNLRSRTHVMFAACCKETKKHFGNASIDSIDWINRNAELNLMIGLPEFRTVHYLDLVTTLSRYAFGTLNLNKLWQGTEIPGAPQMLERLGWKIEGIFRKHNYRNGEYVDVVQTGLLREEFQASQAASRA